MERREDVSSGLHGSSYQARRRTAEAGAGMHDTLTIGFRCL